MFQDSPPQKIYLIYLYLGENTNEYMIDQTLNSSTLIELTQ